MRRSLRFIALIAAFACAGDDLPPSEGAKLVAVAPSPSQSAVVDTSPEVARDTMPTHDAAQLADLDCDGRPDSVALERTDSLITVRVYRASESNPTILEIPVGSYQGGVCSRQAVVVLEDQRSGPDPEEFGDLPGFVPSETCMGFRVEDGDCDSLHVYWNRDLQQFGSWRY
jgi:hypothetical protein